MSSGGPEFFARLAGIPARTSAARSWTPRFLGGVLNVLDVRLAWKPRSDLELSLVGRNLVEESHQEFRWYEVERSVFARLAYDF